jgi:hypothetical protein
LICAGRILVKRRGRAAPERGIARASAVVQGRATIGTRMNPQLYFVTASRSAHSCETVALVDASSPLTYAATPLWAVADPIRCSVTHIQRAETVTDRTLPRCGPLSDVSVSVEQRGKGNKRNLVVWRLTAPLCARAPSLFSSLSRVFRFFRLALAVTLAHAVFRLHAHASSSLIFVLFLSDACLHGRQTKSTYTSEMNMLHRLIVVSAIAAVALAVIRLNAKRASRRATDEAASAEWESEGGSTAASTGSAAPSAYRGAVA